MLEYLFDICYSLDRLSFLSVFVELSSFSRYIDWRCGHKAVRIAHHTFWMKSNWKGNSGGGHEYEPFQILASRTDRVISNKIKSS